MHCLSTRQSPPIIQMKILKPPYETSFFTNFLVEIFSNVTFAIRESPLTFYVILWIMQTFFFKKRKKTDVKIVLISRLTSLPIKTMILNYLSNKCIYAEKANFDRVCTMIFRTYLGVKNLPFEAWSHCGPVSSSTARSVKKPLYYMANS